MAKGSARLKRVDVAAELARAVGAGRSIAIETVDFNDPDRPKVCLEVDFPILPVNRVAAIEGNAGKPIYQMSKWWARRRSSVFRSLLLSASMKAPEDPADAAKAVWDVYYANHQELRALGELKVADIFMGGGTTLVEGSRLGMQLWGTDLNPVAWFVVRNELARVRQEDVRALLADVEAEVKPQIMPLYACNCPRGHTGTWRQKSSGRAMEASFDPLSLTPEGRKDYEYEGPAIVCVFWAKHGPCQVTGCGHRTPLFSSPVVATKTLTVRAWLDYACQACSKIFDIESGDARIAPGAALVVAPSEKPFAVLCSRTGVTCPHCGETQPVNAGKATKKKVVLTLLVHPEWMAGAPGLGPDGSPYGGSTTDPVKATIAWNAVRAAEMKLVELRGSLPTEPITLPDGTSLDMSSATLLTNGRFACGACGTVQKVVQALDASKATAPIAAFAIQAYCPQCDAARVPYGGRYFAPAVASDAFDAAEMEWSARAHADLASLWPKSELPFGHMTHQRQPLPQHGFTHWRMMFNARQLLVHTQLLRAITEAGRHDWATREYVLGAFQQYLRNQNMFCFWNPQRDTLEPMFSNNNYHPKATVIENSVFGELGRGNWTACTESLIETLAWAEDPWELVDATIAAASTEAASIPAKSHKVRCGDPPMATCKVECSSATELSALEAESFDLVVTDPPFGGLLHYAELADFFYVWLRLVLADRYPAAFGAEYTPKALEVVANKARTPDDPDAFYQRLLTGCWREAHRILKPGGILAFTFHHSEDEPWIAVLESLFEAGFYLEATYPIRSDETKGDGEFGSKQIEYDMIHVCRKRTFEPKPLSWALLRRNVLEEVRRLKSLLEHHQKAGLPAADIKVIQRGKALEYYSRHYGRVYLDEERVADVRHALLGINQLLDEEAGRVADAPPVMADPLTRQFLRIFDGKDEQPRDQLQKFLRGTGIAPAEFEERGWCVEAKRVYRLIPALDIAQRWHGKQRKGLTGDYDQAMVLIGACFDGSGINASDILKNPSFRSHPALEALLDWQATRAPRSDTRDAARRALAIHRSWAAAQKRPEDQQLVLFPGETS